mmetsp:Transcript_9662/g.24131  ORF Transcript_9662/g.24131 Transcript_9662/m.24131 type:complete len:216 (-) Transcript_9662:229-876(-)
MRSGDGSSSGENVLVHACGAVALLRPVELGEVHFGGHRGVPQLEVGDLVVVVVGAAAVEGSRQVKGDLVVGGGVSDGGVGRGRLRGRVVRSRVPQRPWRPHLEHKGLQGRVGHAKARRGRPQVPRLVELLAKGHRSTPSSSSSFSMSSVCVHVVHTAKDEQVLVVGNLLRLHEGQHRLLPRRVEAISLLVLRRCGRQAADYRIVPQDAIKRVEEE